MMQADRRVKIAVIGAGVSGLSVVHALSRQLTDAGISSKITIIADRVLDQTLSIGAAGIFRPDEHIGVSRDKNQEWARRSFQHFSRVARSPEAGEAGVFFVSGMDVGSRADYHMDFYKPFCPDLQAATPEQIAVWLPSRFKYGFRYTTIIIDPYHYLKWLLAQALSHCDLVIAKIASLEHDERLSVYDVIVNCTGLGARVIADDDSLIAIRGQTIRVKAPWIKQFASADGVYVYPSSDGHVTLGGIKQLGREDMSVDPHDRQWLWDKCLELQPSLKGAEVVRDWVGLRPFRQPIRVESETLANGRRIVHNYGHGGNGYTYSYGTAHEAAGLVLQSLQQQRLQLKSSL